MYRSLAGRRVLDECYEMALDRLERESAHRMVETRHGPTHLLLAGELGAKPLIVLQGGNATNPMTLSWYEELADTYRLIAPDTVGHPGKSAETRLAPDGEAYAEWLADVLDALDIESAPMIGTSFGAGIIMRTAARSPERIECAVLVVPAGFGTGPLHSLIPIGVSSILYRYVPSEWLLDRIIERLATETTEVDRATIAASLRHVDLEREMPNATAEEVAAFDAPVTVFLGEHDPFFPPATITPRVQNRLEHATVDILPGEKHLLSAAGQARVTESIREWLSRHY